MHADEVQLSDNAVSRLVADQFPQWVGLPIHRCATDGTVNAVFRIGDHLAAPFPLRSMGPDKAAEYLRRETAAMREFARATTIPTPIPVAIGEPGRGYPMAFLVQTWLPPGRDDPW